MMNCRVFNLKCAYSAFIKVFDHLITAPMKVFLSFQRVLMHRGGVFGVFRHLASFAVNDRHHSPPASDGFPFENGAEQEEKVPSHV